MAGEEVCGGLSGVQSDVREVSPGPHEKCHVPRMHDGPRFGEGRSLRLPLQGMWGGSARRRRRGVQPDGTPLSYAVRPCEGPDTARRALALLLGDLMAEAPAGLAFALMRTVAECPLLHAIRVYSLT